MTDPNISQSDHPPKRLVRGVARLAVHADSREHSGSPERFGRRFCCHCFSYFTYAPRDMPLGDDTKPMLGGLTLPLRLACIPFFPFATSIFVFQTGSP